jgi:DNA-binding Lrp family transcriptional regulator
MNQQESQLLTLLQKNSRYTHQELADMLDLTPKEIETKINAFIESGIIRQFTTIINDTHCEQPPIKALVELSIRPEKNTGYESIAKRIYGFPEVISHYLVSGKYDFLLVVIGKNHKEIAHFVFDKLATIKNVQSTTTHFIFKSYKDQGVLMEDPTPTSRLAIMP